MATFSLMTSPVTINLITEDTVHGTKVDEFGQTVNVYRLQGVQINNPSGHEWVLTIYRDGVEVYTANIPIGLVRSFTIQSNRRFDFDHYSISVSRIA